VKLSLGVCKGKAEYDKRQDIRKREDEREMRRASATLRRK
jgi:tmRNA-binding protein